MANHWKSGWSFIVATEKLNHMVLKDMVASLKIRIKRFLYDFVFGPMVLRNLFDMEHWIFIQVE